MFALFTVTSPVRVFADSAVAVQHKLLSDRVAVNSDVEMASPVSLALSCFGINKFIPGASHDLRFTIGQQGA